MHLLNSDAEASLVGQTESDLLHPPGEKGAHPSCLTLPCPFCGGQLQLLPQGVHTGPTLQGMEKVTHGPHSVPSWPPVATLGTSQALAASHTLQSLVHSVREAEEQN